MQIESIPPEEGAWLPTGAADEVIGTAHGLSRQRMKLETRMAGMWVAFQIFLNL